MSQHDMIIDNGPGLAVRQDINAALNALVTVSAGPVEPTTPYSGMLWLDTSIAPNGQLRQRNLANNGWVTPAAGSLPSTGGTLTGDLSLTKTNPTLLLNKAASGQAARVFGQLNGLNRWHIALGDSVAESGGNAGSDFGISRYDDSGALVDAPLRISRANGSTILSAALNLQAGQILFPTTGNPSANPYTFDDYREGAFVPDLRFGNSATGFAYTRREGRYIKVGGSVRWWAGIKLSAKGSGSGIFTMNGLPYTSRPIGSDGVTYFASNVGYFNVMTTAIAGLYSIVPSGGVGVNFYHVVAAGGISVLQTTDTMVGGLLQLELFGSYETAS